MLILRRLLGFLLLCLLVSKFLNATEDTQKYNVESGIIYYDIHGSAMLTAETNLSIVGTGKLRFKNWGETLLKEENAEVLTTGAITHKQQIKRLTKVEDNKVIIVDYDNEQLLEGKSPLLTLSKMKETEGLSEDGTQIVAGFPCEVWRGQGSMKCIYKGVVLKHETEVMGVSYVKVANTARFDINASEESCLLPDYPLQDIGLIKDDSKTKNAQKREDLCKILSKSSLNEKAEEQKFTTLDVEHETRQKFINYIGKEIFNHVKNHLPEELAVLKETRVCLYKAENTTRAQACFETLHALKETEGVLREDDVSEWEKKGKARVLDNIEDEIIDFQSRMPCVNRAQNITDLSTCMK